ncbi:MAG TPA: hypothetical protein VGY31_01885 [Terriglobia bacterium]|nr:hypothetical protein [Terriglobia bacterium]
MAQAVEMGLPVPETIVTNSPEDARIFLSASPQSSVFKVLTGARFFFADTRRITADHYDFLDALEFAPIILQREVEDKRDIRATVIDDEVFAAEIVPNHQGARLDWRLDASASVLAHRLPDSVSDSLVLLVRRLGLRYGAIDLALRSDGCYVFLEINPGGQFLFAEIHAGLPISTALARALLKNETPNLLKKESATPATTKT